MDKIMLTSESLHLTDDEFFNLCVQNRDLNFERDSELNIFIMAPTGNKTSNFNSEIQAEVTIWNRKNKLGYVFGPDAGFTLPNNAMRAPDVAWIKKNRFEALSENEQKKFAHICPDFVIEILSETDSLEQLKRKMDEWMENGCRLSWLIDPKTQTTYIYYNNTSETADFKSSITGFDVMPGFEVKIQDIITL